MDNLTVWISVQRPLWAQSSTTFSNNNVTAVEYLSIIVLIDANVIGDDYGVGSWKENTTFSLQTFNIVLVTTHTPPSLPLSIFPCVAWWMVTWCVSVKSSASLLPAAPAWSEQIPPQTLAWGLWCRLLQDEPRMRVAAVLAHFVWCQRQDQSLAAIYPGQRVPAKTWAMRKRICTCPGVICNQFRIFSFVIKAMSGHTIESLCPIVMIRFRE